MKARIWRLLRDLFGDEPPPRPTGYVDAGAHGGPHSRAHGEDGAERAREAQRGVDDEIIGAVDDLRGGSDSGSGHT